MRAARPDSSTELGAWVLSSPRRAPAQLAVLVAALTTAACGRAAPKPSDEVRQAAAPGDGGTSSTPPPSAPAVADDGTYQGRPIAQTCSYLGADWLDRPERADREQPDRVLDALHLDPHATVADVGAGTGYFSLRLARRVARVLATDLQPEMLALLAANARRDHLTNIETIRGGEHDAGLPAGCCDLVLLVDVYHELSDPPSVMAGIKRALAPHGRLVLVEYRGEDPAVPIKPEHKMTLAQLRRELAALGFDFVESLEFLPEQHVAIFTPGD